MRNSIIGTTSALALAISGTAFAQDTTGYVRGALGASFLKDSSNRGEFVPDFTIAGTALDGVTLPEGTPLGWETEFENGLSTSLAAGFKTGSVRIEVEYARSQNDVDTHSGVFAGDVQLDEVDATVLVKGVTDDLGVTTGALVANGQGDITANYLFANAMYDLTADDAPVQPYVGAGIGLGFVGVDYSPSDTPIIDDDETVFAYQVMAGARVPFSGGWSGFGELSYRGTSDVETDIGLFGGELDIENRGTILEIGLQYDFGR